jgi:leader peptidase (prepilin peptidase)/N-methyltransferase
MSVVHFLDWSVVTALVFGCALVGLLIGSFLNVVIARVPVGESVVSPGSRCPHCGHEIGPADNIPLVSWLMLKGRCRGCGQAISARYPMVELGTALLFGIVAWWRGPSWDLPAFLYLSAVCVALAVIDLDTRRLPDVLTLPSYPVLAVLFLIPAVLDADWQDYARIWLGGAALFALYFVIMFVYPAGMGFGDVKLAGVLGMALGWLGWSYVAVGGFLGFLVGAAVGVLLMFGGRAGRRTAIPFGPSMIAGAFLAFLLAGWVSGWYTGLVNGA